MEGAVLQQLLVRALIKHKMTPLKLIIMLGLAGLAGLSTFACIAEGEFDADVLAAIQFFLGIPVSAMVLRYLIRSGKAKKNALELHDDAVCCQLTARRGEVRSYRIPLNQIQSIKVKRRHQLVICSSACKVKIKDVQDAKPFAKAVSMQIAEKMAEQNMMQRNLMQQSIMQQEAAQPVFVQAPPQERLYSAQEIMEASSMAVQAGMAAAEQSTLQKMQTLDSMRESGLITQADFDRKKDELLAQM